MARPLVVRFESRAAILPLVRAALATDLAYVALPEAPPPGRSTLQIYLGADLVASVSAELVGSGRDGQYPLRLALLEPAHATELRDLAEGDESDWTPVAQVSRAVAPSVPAARFAKEEATLASRQLDALGGPAPRRVLSPRTVPPPSASVEDATSLFDPERLLRASVAPRSAWEGEGPDDDTLPRTPPSLPASSRRLSRPSPFSDDESQTLTGSTRQPGHPQDVSWNVRIAPSTQDPMCGRSIGGGKYVLDSVIGSGAIGIVFKASHRDLGRTVAIKVLHPRYRDDAGLLAVFRTEARAASQLEHPNVARVYDFGQEEDGLVYIVMEYLSGYTLGNVLDARRKLPAARSVELVMQVCAGLSAAHDREIVHRDIKPDNVVLVPAQDDEGQPVEIVKVCDFGIAALGTNRAEAGLAAGTPEYMAPEQSTGSPVKPSADVYACGVVLYEMLTGQLPFTDEQAYRILMKHRSEAPRPPSSLDASIPALLEVLVLRCLDKRPERRYQSARELRSELRKL